MRILALLACMLMAGCGRFAPSDPGGLNVALTHRGSNYYLQLEGDCQYASGMGVALLDETTREVFWRATLRAGDAKQPLLVGGSDQTVSVKTPYQGIETPNRIEVVVSNNHIAWTNTFKFSSIDQGLNGGEVYDDKNISLAELNKDAPKGCG